MAMSNFDRAEYLLNSEVFENDELHNVDSELCEFNDNAEDLAYELAYTRYRLALLEREEVRHKDDTEYYQEHALNQNT